MAAANKTSSMLKVNQFAKDFNIKSKELSTVMASEGMEYKAQKTLTSEEFSILLNRLTENKQIKNIGDYLDGVTSIPKKETAETKAVKTTKEDVKKVEPAKESEKKAESAKTEAPKSEAPKTESSKAEKPKAEPAKAEPVKAESAKKETVKAEPAKVETTKKATIESAPQKEVAKPQQKPQPENVKREQNATQMSHRDESRPMRTDRPAQQGNAQNNNNAYQKPQGARQGFDRPQGGFQQRNDRGNGQFQNNQKGQQRGNGNYQQNRQGGGFDKDERQQNAPREKFKPQPIVRSQTMKGDETKQKGATRVVDMRGGSVDLSKYDEKLDSFIPDNISDMRGGMQRVKKQSANNVSNNFNPKGKDKNKAKKTPQSVTKAPTSVVLPAEIVVSDLASRLKVTSAEVVKRLMMLGMMVTVNQTVDFDTAAMVALEMGISATQEVIVTIEEKLFDEIEDTEEQLVTRPPVVCVMGHVDHGKTSILDAIRHTSVTAGEAGGITQHIGAYRVKVNGQDMTFLDTPGHEAFTAMRARGAQSTDIAILVVAADDGIMPQTVEAINHAKAANIDIVVAINKMDKPTANPDMVKQELTKYELVPEEWGGDVICVPVSALTKQGIDDLLENVLLVAEMKELKANPNRLAKGLIIEAKLDKGRGPVATVLVQNGTLHNGDVVIAGTAVGRVRAMTDHKGKSVKEARPSTPVEIIGLSEVPMAGDEFNAVKDERMARELADKRRNDAKEEVFKANARASLNELFAQISEGVKELNVIVKADVGGSVEAVKQSLEKLSNDEVKVRVIHGAAGGIREGDVMLAAASNAIIVGFNVRPDKTALDSAERQEVEIRTYRVIYDCINEISDAMKGMLAPEFKENLLGHAEVRQTIHVPSVGTIAGSYIQDGKVTRASMIRVVRDGIVIFEDKISSLRRFKDDVKEVAQGYECGIGLERFNDIKVGDVLEAYIMEEIKNKKSREKSRDFFVLFFIHLCSCRLSRKFLECNDSNQNPLK